MGIKVISVGYFRSSVQKVPSKNGNIFHVTPEDGERKFFRESDKE
jgi:hypothetical protein